MNVDREHGENKGRLPLELGTLSVATGSSLLSEMRREKTRALVSEFLECRLPTTSVAAALAAATRRAPQIVREGAEKLFVQMVCKPAPENTAQMEKWARLVDQWFGIVEEFYQQVDQRDNAGAVLMDQGVPPAPLPAMHIFTDADVVSQFTLQDKVRVLVETCVGMAETFVFKTVWGQYADQTAARQQARISEYKAMDFSISMEARKANKDERGFLESQMINHATLYRIAYSAPCTGVIGVEAISAASKEHRPAIGEVLRLMGLARATAVMQLAPNRDVLDVFFDKVLEREREAPQKTKGAAKESSTKKLEGQSEKWADRKAAKKKAARKARKLQFEREVDSTAGTVDEAVVAAGRGARTYTAAQTAEWKQKQVCYRCMKPGHVKSDDVCSGLCGVCESGDHDHRFHAGAIAQFLLNNKDELKKVT